MIAEDRPIISSECPGWICYVEKVVKEPIIHLCSRVKTPQMLAGEMLKRMFCESGVELHKICVGSVNPCHDKKLESFRLEGMLAEDVRALDVVLSTTELMDLINSERQYFDSIVPDDQTLVNWHPEELISARLTGGQALTQEQYQSFKRYPYRTQTLYTSSVLSSTSNNYVNQVFIKAVLDKTGKIVDENTILETLRRNKKGFGVRPAYSGSRNH